MEKIVVRIDADLEDLIPGYLQNRRQDLEAILAALERQDFEAIRVLGHTMKGTGGGYGFDAISDIGRDLEAAAQEQDIPAIHQGVAALRDYLQTVEVVFQ
ncbi:MAG: Hpt domain-containing protein [Desulfobacca sp.]|nr:Hpt domain-containing protein [Desulfobacca sp.]